MAAEHLLMWPPDWSEEDEAEYQAQLAKELEELNRITEIEKQVDTLIREGKALARKYRVTFSLRSVPETSGTFSGRTLTWGFLGWNPSDC